MSARWHGKTALLLGGDSPEREVSLTSGAGVEKALRELGADLLVMDIAEERDWLGVLLRNEVRRVFNILHGGSGENGEVRGALNSVGIPCTGSDVLGSALAMNKEMTKTLWRHGGIPTADWRVATSAADAAAIAEALPAPWFVKPVCGGSSTANAAAQTVDELKDGIALAMREGGGAMVEQLITGGEYTLSVLDDAPLPLIHIVPAQPFYDYHAKYVSDETQFFCPSGLPTEQERALAETGMAAYRLLQCSGWGRVDFLLDDDGNPFFLEVNTVPGMTSHSLVPLAAQQVGLDYTTLVGRILDAAEGGGDE